MLRAAIGARLAFVAAGYLERDGRIIDITADQFEDCSARYIVATQSPWHSTFKESNRDFADFRSYDQNTVRRLSRPYQEILGRIKD